MQKKERLPIYRKAVKRQAEVEEETTVYQQNTPLIQTRSERKTCTLSRESVYIADINPDVRVVQRMSRLCLQPCFLRM